MICYCKKLRLLCSALLLSFVSILRCLRITRYTTNEISVGKYYARTANANGEIFRYCVASCSWRVGRLEKQAKADWFDCWHWQSFGLWLWQSWPDKVKSKFNQFSALQMRIWHTEPEAIVHCSLWQQALQPEPHLAFRFTTMLAMHCNLPLFSINWMHLGSTSFWVR